MFSGIIWQSGQAWKILRKFTLQTLRDFGVGKTSLEEKIFLEIDSATDYLTESPDHLADIRHVSSMMILNVIYSIVFGKRYCLLCELYCVILLFVFGDKFIFTHSIDFG